MITPKINISDSNDQFHEEISPGVWIMDDHKWAFWIWLNHFTKHTTGLPAQLFHFDYHWDAANDFQTDSALSDLSNNSLSELFRLVSEDFICKDGFIAPGIIKGLFNEIHFYCKQKDTQIGFSDEFLNNYQTEQFIHNNIKSIMDIRVKNPYAFDLDIDLFNDSGRYLESKLWTETQLYDFFGICTPLIRSASIVTIAMSFGYSGTNEDTIWLAQYAVSKILEINHPAASGRGM